MIRSNPSRRFSALCEALQLRAFIRVNSLIRDLHPRSEGPYEICTLRIDSYRERPARGEGRNVSCNGWEQCA